MDGNVCFGHVSLKAVVEFVLERERETDRDVSLRTYPPESLVADEDVKKRTKHTN